MKYIFTIFLSVFISLNSVSALNLDDTMDRIEGNGVVDNADIRVETDRLIKDTAPSTCSGSSCDDPNSTKPSTTATGGSGEVPSTDIGTKIPNTFGGDNGFCKEFGKEILGCEQGTAAYLGSGVEQTYVYREFIPQFIKTLLVFGAGIAVLMLVIAGMMFITAMGDEEQRGKATKLITFSLVGLVVMVLSRAIVAIIENLPLG